MFNEVDFQKKVEVCLGLVIILAMFLILVVYPVHAYAETNLDVFFAWNGTYSTSFQNWTVEEQPTVDSHVIYANGTLNQNGTISKIDLKIGTLRKDSSTMSRPFIYVYSRVEGLDLIFQLLLMDTIILIFATMFLFTLLLIKLKDRVK